MQRRIVSIVLGAALITTVCFAQTTVPTKSLYDRLGGQPAVQAVASGLVDKILADARVNKWFAHAEKAIANGDVEALKSACRQLWALLPAEEQRRGYGGTSIAAKDAAYWASSV